MPRVYMEQRSSLSSHDTSLERGNSSYSETYMCSSEAPPLEVEPCDFEPAAGSASETPSSSKPEVGFLNPEPLATRCTTKNNGGPSGGSLGALRSSWIQRLFPGMLGQTARPSENPQEPTGLGLQEASADHSGNTTGFTKELFGNRSTFDDLHCHEASLKIRGMEYVPSSNVEQEAEKKMKSFWQPPQILPAELETRSMQVEHHSVEQHSVSSRFGPGTSQKGYGTSNRPLHQTESPVFRFKTPISQPGGSKHISDTDNLQAERATGDEGPRVDIESIGHQGQHRADIGVSMGSSALPPLSLFAPFKHNRERQLGKKKMAAGLSEDSLLTPLLSSHGYKDYPNDNLKGEEKFDSTLFALYKPSSSIQHSFGLGGIETPFAPFKVVEEQNRPSTSLIKTNALPLDLMEHDGEDTKMDTDVLPEPRAQQADHGGQLGNPPRAYGRSSSNYSSFPLPVIADRREATMFPPNSGPRLNGAQHRVGAVNVHGSTSKAGCQTSAIKLSNKRPSLHEARADDKNFSPAQSFDEQLSVSQGMKLST